MAKLQVVQRGITKHIFESCISSHITNDDEINAEQLVAKDPSMEIGYYDLEMIGQNNQVIDHIILIK